MKIITFKSSEFIRSVPFTEVALLPRKDDVLMFPEGKYKVVQIMFQIPANDAVEVYIEKVS